MASRMLAALMGKYKATFVSGVFDFSFQLKLLLIWVCFSHAHIIKILCLYQNSGWEKLTIKHGLELLVNAVSDKMDAGYLACTPSFSGTLDHCHCLRTCYCFLFLLFLFKLETENKISIKCFENNYTRCCVFQGLHQLGGFVKLITSCCHFQASSAFLPLPFDLRIALPSFF